MGDRHNMRLPFGTCILVVILAFALAPASWAQQEQPEDSGTSTDLWIMPGSNLVRPSRQSKSQCWNRPYLRFPQERSGRGRVYVWIHL